MSSTATLYDSPEYYYFGQLNMSKRAKEYLGISIDKDVLEEIEQRRGLIKRSTYVNDVLRNLVCKNADVSEERGKS